MHRRKLNVGLGNSGGRRRIAWLHSAIQSLNRVCLEMKFLRSRNFVEPPNELKLKWLAKKWKMRARSLCPLIHFPPSFAFAAYTHFPMAVVSRHILYMIWWYQNCRRSAVTKQASQSELSMTAHANIHYTHIHTCWVSRATWNTYSWMWWKENPSRRGVD